MGIREGGNVKKCRPVVKEPSGGTLLFRCALPARGASRLDLPPDTSWRALPRRCLHGVHPKRLRQLPRRVPLPRRCLHGVHHARVTSAPFCLFFASALPKAFTVALPFASALPARGASGISARAAGRPDTLPRRCLHGVHRQKPTNCGTPFCSIRRESVDSFSEINNKDSCADYFPALFCCQGDLHHHYRQPRTDNRPVLRCEQHRLFLFILSSHYRRLL